MHLHQAAAHREIAHCALDVHHLVYNELREKRGFWDDDNEGPVTQRTKEKMSDMITIFAELFHNLPALTFLRFVSFSKIQIFSVFQDDDLQ